MSIWVKTFEKLGHWLSKILKAMGGGYDGPTS